MKRYRRTRKSVAVPSLQELRLFTLHAHEWFPELTHQEFRAVTTLWLLTEYNKVDGSGLAPFYSQRTFAEAIGGNRRSFQTKVLPNLKRKVGLVVHSGRTSNGLNEVSQWDLSALTLRLRAAIKASGGLSEAEDLDPAEPIPPPAKAVPVPKEALRNVVPVRTPPRSKVPLAAPGVHGVGVCGVCGKELPGSAVGARCSAPICNRPGAMPVYELGYVSIEDLFNG